MAIKTVCECDRCGLDVKYQTSLYSVGVTQRTDAGGYKGTGYSRDLCEACLTRLKEQFMDNGKTPVKR